MFLLPAIGAWVSDGLILYIHFSNNGKDATTSTPNSGGGNNNILITNGVTGCGDINTHCRNLGATHLQHENYDMRYNNISNRTLQSFPDVPHHVRTNDDNVIAGTMYNDELTQQDFVSSFTSNTLEDESDNNTPNKDDTIGISATSIESNTGYLAILATIRLLVLTVPLSYAAYFGTRVPCVVCHFIFEGISAMLVVSHMLAVLIVDPGSLAVSGDTTNPTGGSVVDEDDETRSIHDDAWALLSLSLVSILLHFLIVLHVRSTGPAQDWLYEEHKRKRKRMAYAMTVHNNGYRGKGGTGGYEPMINGHHEDEEEENDDTNSPLLLPSGNSQDKSLSNNSKQLWKERLMCLPDQYEAFVSEAQSRFDAARRMWGDRLEDATRNTQQGNGNGVRDADNENGVTNGDAVADSQSTPTNLLSQAIQTAATNATQLQSKLARPDPFRVLLQLFAYEDVWTNNRLEMAFASDQVSGDNGEVPASEGSAALSFYAPQLLSFLLHGAYFDISSKLEEWILKKCSEDLHFAHRCFWFLRSWCLGGTSQQQKPGHTRSRSGSSLGGIGGLEPSSGSLNGNILSLEPGNQLLTQYVRALSRLRGVESNLYISYCQGLMSGPYHCNYSSSSSPALTHMDTTLYGVPNSPIAWDSYALAVPDAVGVESSRETSTSKFSPDEQVLIEQLLQRVIEEGIRPAIRAQYGSVDGKMQADVVPNNEFTFSPSALATAVEGGLLPIDPKTGFHSAKHLDCITSPKKYGFLPLNTTGEPYQQQCRSSDGTSLFFAAPMFSDALLSIADDLMEVPRSNRTAELRQRLRSLEVELLPSNVVYVPIRNMSHRVWRIVSDESLALSTNERVPCIVCLEVIDYAQSTPSNNKLNNASDTAITKAWVGTPRPPKRHSTIIDKMANYTQEGLRMLEDTLSHHGDGKSGQLERRLSDFLQVKSNSWKKYAPIRSVESVEEDDEEAPAEKPRVKSPKQGSTDGDDDSVLELCPPPPLGSPNSSLNGEGNEASSLSSSFYPSSSLESNGRIKSDHRNGTGIKTDSLEPPRTPIQESQMGKKIDSLEPPRTPTEESQSHDAMGQWSTPTSVRKPSLKLRKRNNLNDIDQIDEESDNENASPQAKQRKRVTFPPSSRNMARSESFGDTPRFTDPVTPADTDDVVLKSIAPTVVFKEDWNAKTERLRKCSVYGSHPGWRLLPILIKSNDDLRQEQLASQLIQRMTLILAKAKVPVWLFPYEIVALTGRGGIIECVPDTISLDSLKRNDPDFVDLKSFFRQHFGSEGSTELCDAKANFVESLAVSSSCLCSIAVQYVTMPLLTSCSYHITGLFHRLLFDANQRQAQW